jgi:hypothetical protein
MDRHRQAELRSLAYHRAIAARLTTEPDLIVRARVRIERDATRATTHPAWAAVWRRLLALPPDELAGALIDPGEAMTAARQATPFAGALTAKERWSLWRSISAAS